jgi:hypothetical protein
MKYVLILILFLSLLSVSFSQQNLEEVVYLKNGSIIRGVIIEQIPNKSIKIETADGNIFVFKMEEIEKFTKEPVKVKSNKSDLKPTKSDTTSSDFGSFNGFQTIIEIGFGSGYESAFMANLGLGYKVNPYFYIGTIIGFRNNESHGYFPLFLDLRVNFINNKFSPFITSSFGYSVAESVGRSRTGLLISETVGISFRGNNSSLSLGVNYETLFRSNYTIDRLSGLFSISFY